MNRHRLSISGLLGIAAIGAAVQPLCAVTRNEYVGTFTTLKVPNNISVVYHCKADSAGYARFDLPKGAQSPFIFGLNKEKETLTIETSVELPDSAAVPVIHVYSRSLKEVESSSNRSIYIRNLAPVPVFNIALMDNGSIIVPQLNANTVKAAITTGAGTISLTGTCSEADFIMLGTGHIFASELMADTVNCSILGGGEITCWPLDRLTSKGIGSTHIWYKGMPDISKKGGGHIKPIFDRKADGSNSVAAAKVNANVSTPNKSTGAAKKTGKSKNRRIRKGNTMKTGSTTR